MGGGPAMERRTRSPSHTHRVYGRSRPARACTPQRYLFEEMIYVVSGRGATSVCQ